MIPKDDSIMTMFIHESATNCKYPLITCETLHKVQSTIKSHIRLIVLYKKKS